jgi:signal transduction histidine kinase
MLAELTRVDALVPLVTSVAAALTVQGVLAGRRRTALNEALHELRRPLQALVLHASSAPDSATGGADLPQQTALALRRLDREINGGADLLLHSPVSVATLLDEAVGRCRLRAREASVSLHLEPAPEDLMINVHGAGFAQALDNLIINAIEHGGPLVLVGIERRAGALLVRVADSGRLAVTVSRRRSPVRALAALTGRERHGHGLRVVRRVAATNGAEFHLRRLGIGVEALLELPLPSASGIA